LNPNTSTQGTQGSRAFFALNAFMRRRQDTHDEARKPRGPVLAVTGLDEDAAVGRLVPGVVLAGVGSGVLNVATGRGAVASVPPGRASLGTGANTTARYLGSSIGVSIVATVVAAAGPTPRDLVHGWNQAALLTATLSALGAGVVLLCRSRPDPGPRHGAEPRPARL